MPTLKNWSVGIGNAGAFTAPELYVPVLGGEVYGHLNFPDGEHITTSAIIDYDASEGCVITQSGTRYSINAEDVAPEYEAKYPGAHSRLVASLGIST